MAGRVAVPVLSLFCFETVALDPADHAPAGSELLLAPPDLQPATATTPTATEDTSAALPRELLVILVG